MAVGLMPVGNDAPFLDSSGNPLNGGLLYFYTAGSSTPQNTYTTSAGNVANANPVVLDAGGYPASGGSVVGIWGTVGVSYKATLKTSAGVTVWTRDNLPIINDVSSTVDQWESGPAPTYLSATTFSLVGDQTSDFTVGRRLKSTNSGGTIYSRISASAFGVVTTVTVVNDSGTLDSGLSAVFYGLLTSANTSIPVITDANPIISGSADLTKLVKLEADGLTTATTRTLTVQDANGTIGLVESFPKLIQGLTYSNGTDATNDINIAAGVATDATGVQILTLAATLVKQLDAAWAVGSAAGGLDTGSIGDSDYYIWLIKRSDTKVVDGLFSLSSTAPTMPASYDYKRLIGWFKRVSAAIVTFTTYETVGGGLELLWKVPTLDINLASTLTTATRTDAVKVPLNFSVLSHLNVLISDASAGANAWIYCPDQTDAAPSITAAPLANIRFVSTDSAVAQQMTIRTSAAGLIAARADLATVDLYAVSTMGFTWARRN